MIKIEIVTLAEVKEALRIDYDDEDTYLTLCIDVAESYIKDSLDDYAIKILKDSFKNKAKLIVLMTVQNLFDDRTLTEQKANERLKYMVSSLLSQMRWS